MNCHYNGLAIIRELGKHKVPIIAMDCIHSVGTFSRFAAYRKCPNPAEHEYAFIDCLYQTAAKLDGKPVLIPTNDIWAMAIARHKDKLQEVSLPCVADAPVVDLLIDKVKFNQWCTSHYYPIPGMWNVSDYGKISDETYPVILKPVSRRTSSDDARNVQILKFFDKNRMVIVNSKRELEAKLAQLGAMKDCFFIQEYVPGLSDHMYTIGIYADREHAVKGVFTGRKMRGYPADIGDCRLGESCVLPQNLIDMVVDFCRKIGYSGIAEFEFKKNDQSGEYKLIEVNPRSWSWVGITPSCGVSLPWMAYVDTLDLEQLEYKVSSVKTGEVKYVRLLDDLINCLFRYRRDGYPQWSLGFREWLASIKSNRLVMAEFEKGDWLAYFLNYASKIPVYVASLWKRLLKIH